MTKFAELGLCPDLLRALEEAQYKQPTPIQTATIPTVLQERDVLACAQTGTGKTAAFALPILELLLRQEPAAKPKKQARPAFKPTARARHISTLVLAPTRELAHQIGESFELYAQFTSIRCGVVTGGVPGNPQVRMLRAGIDILVATPGRLLDHLDQGNVSLADVTTLVLDEADRMLDMGFIRDIREILSELPEQRQTLLFSATMPKSVRHLATEILYKPSFIEVARPSTTPASIQQSMHRVPTDQKRHVVLHLLREPEVDSTIVFTRTKHGASRLAEFLQHNGQEAVAFHGNKSQAQRRTALSAFKAGKVRTLVATDIAARGIDVEGISHVINFDVPASPEDYVHRIGRTGRAAKKGHAISLVSESEHASMRNIEKRIGCPIALAQPLKFQEKPRPNHGRSRA